MRNLALMWVLAGVAVALLAAGDGKPPVSTFTDSNNKTTSLPEKKEYGIDDLMDELIGDSKITTLDDSRHKKIIDTSKSARAGVLTGSRSRASIQRVVMRNMTHLRYAYINRLREKTDLDSSFIIIVKFAIDEFGKVISARVTESTTNDTTFDNTLVKMINGWGFEKIDTPGDTTVVTYPFTFAQ